VTNSWVLGDNLVLTTQERKKDKGKTFRSLSSSVLVCDLLSQRLSSEKKGTLLEGHPGHNLDGLYFDGHPGPMLPYLGPKGRHYDWSLRSVKIRETCLLELVSPRMQASPQTL